MYTKTVIIIDNVEDLIEVLKKDESGMYPVFHNDVTYLTLSGGDSAKYELDSVTPEDLIKRVFIDSWIAGPHFT